SDTARQAAFRDLGSNDPEDRIIWLRAPAWIIRAEPMRPDGTELSQVTIFKLGHNGSLEHRLDADAAHFRQNNWQLVDVIETSARTGEESRIATLDWHSSLAPYDMKRDETDRSVSMADAKAVLAGERMATEPRSFYEMRASRAVSIAAMPAVLILLAAPVVLGSGRSNAALVQAVVIAAALGLAFVMSEGLAASLGEKGLVEPQVAAWSPILIAMLLGFWAMLRAEG
ncbi:MAG: LptF/LptG family permease, partial [Pseudomonadota bacterium]